MLDTVTVNVSIDVMVIHPDDMTDLKVEGSAIQSIQTALAEVIPQSDITSIAGIIKKD